MEGETDPPYLCRAAELLGRGELLAQCEIQWIGAKNTGGQGFNTGKGALDHTLSFLRANPKLTRRPILLLYDNDSNKTSGNYDNVSVRVLPTNSGNMKVKVGAENLLEEHVITEEYYSYNEKRKDNGDIVTVQSIKKMDLCERMCLVGTTDDFSGFAPALDMIDEYLRFLKTDDADNRPVD